MPSESPVCRHSLITLIMNPQLFTPVPRTWFVAALGLSLCSPAIAAPGEWMSLFDGKSLTGWEANESPGTWVVEDGAIVTKGPRSHLFYTGPAANHDFKNFELSAEV